MVFDLILIINSNLFPLLFIGNKNEYSQKRENEPASCDRIRHPCLIRFSLLFDCIHFAK